MAEYVLWLRGLAEKGGKGVVNNIDARCLGRIGDELERLRGCLEEIAVFSSDPVSALAAQEVLDAPAPKLSINTAHGEQK